MASGLGSGLGLRAWARAAPGPWARAWGRSPSSDGAQAGVPSGRHEPRFLRLPAPPLAARPTPCIRRSFNLPPVPYFSPEKCFEPVNLFRCLQNKRSPCGRRRAALLVLDDTWSPFPSSSAPPPLPRGPMLRRRHGSVPRKKERLFCKAESAQLCSTLGVGGRGGGARCLSHKEQVGAAAKQGRATTPSRVSVYSANTGRGLSGRLPLPSHLPFAANWCVMCPRFGKNKV